MIPGTIGAGYRRTTPPPFRHGRDARHPIRRAIPCHLRRRGQHVHRRIVHGGLHPCFVMTTSMCITAYCIAPASAAIRAPAKSFLPCGSPRRFGDGGRWRPGDISAASTAAYLPHFTEAADLSVLDAVRRPVRLPQADVEEDFPGAYPYLAFAGSATVLVGVSMAFLRPSDPVPHP